MGKAILSTLLLCLTLSAFSHDMRMAHYYIYVEGGRLYCDVKIDLEDLEKVLASEADQESINTFIDDNLSFHFDGQSIGTELFDFKKSENWVDFKLELKTSNTNPVEVQIFNTVLSGKIKGHDNLMRFILHGKKRIFRLTKDRKQISFSYKNS